MLTARPNQPKENKNKNKKNTKIVNKVPIISIIFKNI
jgi:hypothetical protein